MSKASDALTLQTKFRNGMISINEFRTLLDVTLTSISVNLECSLVVADCGDYKLRVVPSW